MSDTMTHIAGLRIHIGTLIRQRCAWCGITLIEEDEARVETIVGDDGAIFTWEPGAQVRVEQMPGVTSRTLVEGDLLPPDSCAKIDPAVTA